jgi:hypothetical protein
MVEVGDLEFQRTGTPARELVEPVGAVAQPRNAAGVAIPEAGQLAASAQPTWSPVERPAATSDELEAITGERADSIVTLLQAQASMTTAELAGLLEIPRRTCLRDLTRLVEEGRVRRTGKRRAARYELVE